MARRISLCFTVHLFTWHFRFQNKRIFDSYQCIVVHVNTHRKLKGFFFFCDFYHLPKENCKSNCLKKNHKSELQHISPQQNAQF